MPKASAPLCVPVATDCLDSRPACWCVHLYHTSCNCWLLCAVMLQLAASLPAEKWLENDAERIRLVQQLLSGPSSNAVPSKASTRRPSRSASRAAQQQAQPTLVTAGPATEASTADAASALVSGTRHPPVAPKLPELVSGHYLLDFGSVVKGINKSKKVKMTNMSSQQVKTA